MHPAVRRTIWAARVVLAFAAGALVRARRRRAGRGPRIRHGTFPMHMTRSMVDVDRLAGFDSASIVHHVELNPRYALVTAGDFDIVLSQRLAWDEWHWATLEHLLRHADVFVMYCDTRFASPHQAGKTRAALMLLRTAGVRLIAVTSGLDVVHDNGVTTRFDFLGRLRRDYPDWDLALATPVKKAELRAICDCAHFVVAGDATCARFLPREDARFKFFPVARADAVAPLGERRGPVRIVHAPNHRHIKGTEALVVAVQQLRAQGLDCELVLLENTPPAEARAVYESADIIADQFGIGSFGLFALEGLALGKPVLAYLDQEHLGDPAFNLPIVNANPANLARVLAPLARSHELRRRLGEAGREGVERFHSPAALAAVWTAIYRHVWNGDGLDLDAMAHFGAQRGRRSFTEDPCDEAFWPAPVSDLMPAIREAACA
jgi:glycosyltransferase involved in cell wall biosynthesis